MPKILLYENMNSIRWKETSAASSLLIMLFREELCLEWRKLHFLFMLKSLVKPTFVIFETFKQNIFAFWGEQNCDLSQILNM
jgi:hypothetical protein